MPRSGSVDLPVMVHEENDQFVAYCPSLDLYTHGDSIKDARTAAVEAAEAFIEELLRMGTVKDVLEPLGWKIRSVRNPRERNSWPQGFSPPEYFGTFLLPIELPV